MKTCFIAYSLGFFYLLVGFAAFGARMGVCGDFTDEIERDFAIRSIGQLQVTNLRGPISIQGWSQDRIRVKAKRHVTAENSEESKRLLSAMDFRFRVVGKDIELSAEYGRGLEIKERLQEQLHPKGQMEIQIFAPAHFDLRVWGVDSKVLLKGWSAPAEVRTIAGAIQVEGVKAKYISLLCPRCAMSAQAVKGDLRCMGGEGNISLMDVQSDHLYVETVSGEVRATHVTGEQLFVSKTGKIHGEWLKGRVDFHTQAGAIELLSGSGFVSGSSQSGAVSVQMSEWKFSDDALIETTQGDVELILPPSFSGDVDLKTR